MQQLPLAARRNARVLGSGTLQEDLAQLPGRRSCTSCLCHKATSLPADERSAHPCQGWLRVLGFEAIGVRLAVMRGHASPDEVQTPAKHDLYSSFSEMMAANGVAEPERNVYVPTPRPRRSSRKRR